MFSRCSVSHEDGPKSRPDTHTTYVFPLMMKEINLDEWAYLFSIGIQKQGDQEILETIVVLSLESVVIILQTYNLSAVIDSN
jgi:hypothetical protein